MKSFFKIINIILYLLVASILLAALGTAIVSRPFMLSVIRSYSMYPQLNRGDLVLIRSLSPEQSIETGDIVLFQAESGSLASQGWIIHRIVDGNAEIGYITQGDNNDQTDQENGGSPPVQRDWIVSRALTLAGAPIKIPLLGYVPLWAEQFQQSAYALPLIGLLLALILAASELAPKRKKSRSKRTARLEEPLLYVFAGLTLGIILLASMLATSQNLTLVYQVSDNQQGVMLGSDVGVMLLGEAAERPLVELNNRSFLPIVATCTSSDTQIGFTHDFLYLNQGQYQPVNFRVNAMTPGIYRSKIWIGMFFPLLPASIIYWLARQSFWLALFTVAFLPALPLICYPLCDARLRHQVNRELGKGWRRFRSRWPL